MVGRMVRVMVVALALPGAVAAIARADGLPVLGFVTATHGVRTLDGARRYAARVRGHETVLSAMSPAGRTLARSVLDGRFDVPVVAYDGSAAGLSANGRTLVLIRPRVAFPQRSTELAILAARPLRLRRFERLRGDFSFDAISPNGAWLYLIQYTSRVDPTRYRVRALSTGTGKLRSRDIVDPRDRGEAMRGNPIARVSSTDGRWAYTLYDGNGRPFVHALDTAGQTARCIDVAAFPPSSDPWQARLSLTGQRLNVVLAGGRTLSRIDTTSLSVLAPPSQLRRKRTTRPRPAASVDIVPIAIALVLLAGAVAVLRRRLGRPRPTGSAAAPDSAH
jgi:hypothetical protein